MARTAAQAFEIHLDTLGAHEHDLTEDAFLSDVDFHTDQSDELDAVVLAGGRIAESASRGSREQRGRNLNQVHRSTALQLSEVEEILERKNKIMCPKGESQSNSRAVAMERRSSVLNGLWACLSPVVSFIRKEKKLQVSCRVM